MSDACAGLVWAFNEGLPARQFLGSLCAHAGSCAFEHAGVRFCTCVQTGVHVQALVHMHRVSELEGMQQDRPGKLLGKLSACRTR